MTSEPLKQQAKALENQFFSQLDQKLLANLKDRLERETKRDVLAHVANVKNQEVLDQLLDLGIDAETFTALMFVPLAAVAWADGSVSPEEHEAILKTAEAHNMQPGGLGYQMLASWIQTPPADELFQTWKLYVAALKKEMNPEWFAKLKTEVLHDAKKVADASGGILGFGRTSKAEQKRLDELEMAFDE